MTSVEVIGISGIGTAVATIYAHDHANLKDPNWWVYVIAWGVVAWFVLSLPCTLFNIWHRRRLQLNEMTENFSSSQKQLEDKHTAPDVSPAIIFLRIGETRMEDGTKYFTAYVRNNGQGDAYSVWIEIAATLALEYSISDETTPPGISFNEVSGIGQLPSGTEAHIPLIPIPQNFNSEFPINRIPLIKELSISYFNHYDIRYETVYSNFDNKRPPEMQTYLIERD